MRLVVATRPHLLYAFSLFQVEEVLRHLNSLGLRDGVSKSLKQSVDGIPLKTHLEVLQSIRTLTAV